MFSCFLSLPDRAAEPEVAGLVVSPLGQTEGLSKRNDRVTRPVFIKRKQEIASDADFHRGSAKALEVILMLHTCSLLFGRMFLSAPGSRRKAPWLKRSRAGVRNCGTPEVKMAGLPGLFLTKRKQWPRRNMLSRRLGGE